ncbi:MAG: aminopeptidase [Candidatus Lokiarchaeota archaeon]|nr:aminopeptidase [Candidatus Lokiarchaeota archaeon]
MISEFNENLAKLAVNYAVEVKKGQRVVVQGPSIAEDLFQALYAEILKAGGHPLLIPDIEGTEEMLYKYGSEEQLLYVDEVKKIIIRDFDCLINIYGDYNRKKLSLVDPKKIAQSKSSPGRLELFKTYMERDSKGEFNWVVIPYPCNSMAQEAGMDLFSYSDFVKKALILDKEDPVKEWKDIEKKQDVIVEYLNNVEKIQVLGEDTDLSLSVKGRKWINCCGHKNLPDGEVFTAPLEDSVNGHIRFTYPGIFQGKEIENIYLEFKNGKVTKATADKAEDLLQELIAIKNADILGEFAIGTNYGITDFTKNMLFDEKIGGTLHSALGMGPPETGSTNQCAIHWDILKDMRLPGSKIIADRKVIYEEGHWKN